MGRQTNGCYTEPTLYKSVGGGGGGTVGIQSLGIQHHIFPIIN